MENGSFGRFVTVFHCRGGQGKSRELEFFGKKKCSDFLCCPLFEQSVEVVFTRSPCLKNPHGAIAESGVGEANAFELQGDENDVGTLSKIKESSGSILEEEFLFRCTQIPFFIKKAFFELEIEDARKRFEAFP